MLEREELVQNGFLSFWMDMFDEGEAIRGVGRRCDGSHRIFSGVAGARIMDAVVLCPWPGAYLALPVVVGPQHPFVNLDRRYLLH